MKIHGRPPFHIALLHSGPGAAGEMYPLARQLSSRFGILEPHQSALCISGRVSELREDLLLNGTPRFILTGFSWGAWPAVIFAARHPELVKKIILIGSGGFHERCAQRLIKIRQSRLSSREWTRFNNLMRRPDANMGGLLALLRRTDLFDPLPDPLPHIPFNRDVYQKLWPEAAKWRREGKLLQAAVQIKCPVTAIHGDFDPHPAAGVRIPLGKSITDFKFILLKQCGHKPWIEKQARADFYRILTDGLMRGK